VKAWLEGLGLAHRESDMWHIPGATDGGALQAVVKYAFDDALDGIDDKLAHIVEEWDVAEAEVFLAAVKSLKTNVAKKGTAAVGALRVVLKTSAGVTVETAARCDRRRHR
jgi:hypothetical protein